MSETGKVEEPHVVRVGWPSAVVRVALLAACVWFLMHEHECFAGWALLGAIS